MYIKVEADDYHLISSHPGLPEPSLWHIQSEVEKQW
jgi:hypothetical protein